MGRKYPPPCDEAFLLVDGQPVPIKELPPEVWLAAQDKMMENVGRVMSAYWTSKFYSGELEELQEG